MKAIFWYLLKFLEKVQRPYYPPIPERRMHEIEDSITVYTFIDGVEQRRAAFPRSFERLHAIFDEVIKAFKGFSVSLDSFAKAFEPLTQALAPPDLSGIARIQDSILIEREGRPGMVVRRSLPQFPHR